MTIHFFINSAFPHGMAAAKRRLCYAKGLMAAGDSVLVHCTHRVFNQGEDDGFPVSGEYQGIPFHYISGKYKRTNTIARGLDWELLDSIRAFFYALKCIRENEIVYLYFYPVLLQILLILASKIKGAKVVKETCEHPSALEARTDAWFRFCRWMEYHFVMPLYDGFIPISRQLDKFVQKYKSKKACSIIVPILVEEDAFALDFSSISSPYKEPYIIHTGTMYEQKDSISRILSAFARYKKEHPSDLKLVFTGPHANSNCSYLPLIKDLGIESDVELLGLVSVQRVAILQHFAAMTIIYKSDNLQTRNCFSTKLGEMLISGVPVITTTIGESSLYLETGKSALLFEPDDEDMLVSYIHTVLSDADYARNIGLNGMLVARKQFNPVYQGERLHLFFIDLIVKQ